MRELGSMHLRSSSLPSEDLLVNKKASIVPCSRVKKIWESGCCVSRDNDVYVCDVVYVSFNLLKTIMLTMLTMNDDIL